MCGRYTLTSTDHLKRRFDTTNSLPKGVGPNYNAAPTQIMPVVLQNDGDRIIHLMHWGVIPVWAKNNPRFAFSTFNAKAETLLEKTMWKKLIASKRCLVPATGFYEWKKIGTNDKQPYYIRVKNQDIFALAGLYDEWTDNKSGDVFSSFTIITTAPNKTMKEIHDRMPVILDKDEEDEWLNTDNSAEDVMPLLDSYKDKGMELYPVDKTVGNVKNNKIELT